MTDNPQDLLWSIPSSLGNGWWLICSAFALPGAGLCFLYLIMNERMSVLVFSRLLMTGGLLAIGLVPLNSGWLPWGVLLLSAGGFCSYFLIATNWCNRHDKLDIIRLWWAKVIGAGHVASYRDQRPKAGSD